MKKRRFTPVQGEVKHPVELLRGVTMAFMVLLSREEDLTLSYTDADIESFPYENMQIELVEDPDGTTTHCMLTSRKEMMH